MTPVQVQVLNVPGSGAGSGRFRSQEVPGGFWEVPAHSSQGSGQVLDGSGTFRCRFLRFREVPPKAPEGSGRTCRFHVSCPMLHDSCLVLQVSCRVLQDSRCVPQDVCLRVHNSRFMVLNHDSCLVLQDSCRTLQDSCCMPHEIWLKIHDSCVIPYGA